MGAVRCATQLFRIAAFDYATGNICCKRRSGLNSIAAFCDPILPSSYGLILSECGGNQYLHRRQRGPFYERLPYGKREPSPRSDEKRGANIPATNGHQPSLVTATCYVKHVTRDRMDGPRRTCAFNDPPGRGRTSALRRSCERHRWKTVPPCRRPGAGARS
jgi:hypothetical protein